MVAPNISKILIQPLSILYRSQPISFVLTEARNTLASVYTSYREFLLNISNRCSGRSFRFLSRFPDLFPINIIDTQEPVPVVDTSQLCSFTITDLVKNTEDKVEGLVNKWESMITLDRNFREISILLRTISQIGKSINQK